MAFDKTKLELLAGSGANLSLYAYTTAADAKAAVDTAGYFNGASATLRVGDFMLIKASDGIGIATVLSNASGVVDIGDLTAIGGTDTD